MFYVWEIFELPSLNFFFETIIISRCCLKMLSSSSCSYCISCTLVIIFTSGSTEVDSSSFFISVSKWSLNLKSIFCGKFIFPMSVNYFRGTLCTCSSLIISWNFVILSCIIRSVAFFLFSAVCASSAPSSSSHHQYHQLHLLLFLFS